jgi:hypothetical protein
VRLFHFTTDSGYEQIAADGFSDWTSWGFRQGVELSESTSTDAFTPTSCWLLVLDVDEELIAPYEGRQPASQWLRSALARLRLGPRGREWLVPAQVLNAHARVIDVGDFSDPAFAARYRTRMSEPNEDAF